MVGLALRMAAPAGGVRRALRQSGHGHLVRGNVGQDLDEPRRADADRQQEGVMREGDRADELGQQKTVRHFDGVGEPVGEPEGAQEARRGEDGQTVGLHGPERVVGDQVFDAVADHLDVALGDARFLDLRQRRFQEILELDPIRLRVLGHRRRAQVERNGRAAKSDELGDFGLGGKIDIEQDAASSRWERAL